MSDSTSTPNNSHLGYRPDIDGLRAIAILAVLIYHAFPHMMTGGYSGVDIFFVISGYLITGNILKSQTAGQFTLADFYGRRIKRIFPSLIVVLVFCLAAGWFILLPDEFAGLGKHVAAGSIYISNFLLIREAGYFDHAAELKPLLHLWSLAIEEQFYLFWPLMLIIASRLRISPIKIILPLILLSFFYNIVDIHQNPTGVFYSPVTRSWELLIGAALAYTNLFNRAGFDRLMRRLHLGNQRLAMIGLLFLVAGFAFIRRDSVFPGWWALLPTVGSACLISAGPETWFNRRVLAGAPAVFIGLISYPMYLWHYPLISFAHIIEGGVPSLPIRTLAAASSVLLAWGTYAFVEKQIRFRRDQMVAPILFAVVIVIGISGYVVFREHGFPGRHPRAEELARQFGPAYWSEEHWDNDTLCLEKFGNDFNFCKINDVNKPPTVMLVGDSHANHFYPGLATLFAKRGDNLLNLGQGGCPPLFGTDVTLYMGSLHCDTVMAKALKIALETSSIKTVVLSTLGESLANGVDRIDNLVKLTYPQNPAMTDPMSILETSLRDTFRRLTEAGKQVVFIFNVPILEFDPATCTDTRPWRLTAAKLKTPCAVPRKKEEALSKSFRQLVSKVAAEFPQVKIWDPRPILCNQDLCWAEIDHKALYRDAMHLSLFGSYLLGEKLPLSVAR